MILVRLQGGLGNQLFQYAFALLLHEILPANVFLETAYYRNDPFKRSYALDFLPTRLPILDDDVSAALTRKRKLGSVLKFLFPLRHLSVISDDQMIGAGVSAPEISRTYRDHHFIGYWQASHLVDLSPTLPKDLSLVRAQLLSGCDLLNKFPSDKRLVAVHSRRHWLNDSQGNIVPRRKIQHLVLGLDYYEEAFARIGSIVDSPFFLLFGDDASWNEKNLLPLAESKGGGAVVRADGRPAYQDLLLMSACEGVVCSNSSFAWWAARLCSGPVVTPARWLRDDDLEGKFDFLRDDWIPI